MKNWKTTLLGAILGAALYWQQAGAKLPTTGDEAVALGLGLVIAVVGALMKDSTLFNEKQ